MGRKEYRLADLAPDQFFFKQPAKNWRRSLVSIEPHLIGF